MIESNLGIATICIEPREVKIFRDMTSDIIPQMNTISEANFLDEMRERGLGAREKLPELITFLDSMKSHTGPKVAIIDFPKATVDDLRPTPTNHLVAGEKNLFPQDVYRGLILGMTEWYGYGYTTQQNAVIHNNIVQVKELASVPGHSASAPHELGLHVEDASYNLGEGRDISPDFLTLHYLRNPHNVPTLVSLPQWDQLSSNTRDLLSEKWFFNRTNPAQGGEGNNPESTVSVIYGPSEDPWIRLNTAKLDLEQYEPSQQAALIEMRNHLEKQRLEILAESGQILIIDNRRVLHGRPAFKPSHQPYYNGTDRWQRRLVISNDSTRIQNYEASHRIVDPQKVIFEKPDKM